MLETEQIKKNIAEMEYTAAEAILQPDHTPAGEKKSPSFSPLTGNPQKVSKKTTKHQDFHNVALKKQRQCIKLLQNRTELLKKQQLLIKNISRYGYSNFR